MLQQNTSRSFSYPHLQLCESRHRSLSLAFTSLLCHSPQLWRTALLNHKLLKKDREAACRPSILCFPSQILRANSSAATDTPFLSSCPCLLGTQKYSLLGADTGLSAAPYPQLGKTHAALTTGYACQMTRKNANGPSLLSVSTRLRVTPSAETDFWPTANILHERSRVPQGPSPALRSPP